MKSSDQKAALGALGILLRPLVRVLIRLKIPFGSFAEVARQVYVQVADEAFRLEGRKQTQSRIAVLTGLTRKEVARIQALPPDNDSALDERFDRCTRVISGWLQTDGYVRDGQPRALSFEGEEPSFKALVARYSGDMPPRAVMDELMRTGALGQREDGLLVLRQAAFVPSRDLADKLAMLGRDTADLIDSIAHNLEACPSESRFQLRVAYDNLSREAVDAFRRFSDEHSMALLRRYDEWLAQHDRDEHPELGGTGRFRAGVGLYYLEEEIAEELEK